MAYKPKKSSCRHTRYIVVQRTGRRVIIHHGSFGIGIAALGLKVIRQPAPVYEDAVISTSFRCQEKPTRRQPCLHRSRRRTRRGRAATSRPWVHMIWEQRGMGRHLVFRRLEECPRDAQGDVGRVLDRITEDARRYGGERLQEFFSGSYRLVFDARGKSGLRCASASSQPRARGSACSRTPATQPWSRRPSWSTRGRRYG
jgi:hypothetical protein